MMAIPTHEPEVILARAKSAPGGDDEKVATTSLKSLTVAGVSISSRYDKAHELERMARMVEAVPQPLRSSLTDLWCDSKAQACYTASFRQGTSTAKAEATLDVLETASGGHNGIWVQGADVSSRDPSWPGDE